MISAEIDRKTFIKEKLNNFILFIKETFGPNNILLTEYKDYLNLDSYDPFLKGLLTICEYLELPMDTPEKKQNNINKISVYLNMKNLTTDDERKYKMLRYFELFYKTF